MRRTSNYLITDVLNKKTQCAATNKSVAPHRLDQQITADSYAENKKNKNKNKEKYEKIQKTNKQ